MPQNTPMKRQFTTIDGRTVMSNLPQHWGGNDWKITGVDNPLPVGNYVQTEAGVWIPQKGSDDGAADVRVTGSIVEFDVANQVEIRDDSVHSFRIDIPKGIKDFDIFLTDTHGVSVGNNRTKMFDLYFSLHRASAYAFGDISILADDGEFYNWNTRLWAYAEFRNVKTKIKSQITRNALNRERITLEQMLRASEAEFYINQSLQEVSYADKEFPVEDMKKSILTRDYTHFNIRLDGLPDDISQIQGSISIQFRGYY